MVFQKFLEGLPNKPAKLQFIFSKNLMSCLMNQAAKEDRYLHRAAVKALKAIEAVTAAVPGCLVTVLENLLGQNGSYNFDQRTATKTIDRLLQHSNKQNRSAVFDVIQQPIQSLTDLAEDQTQPTLRIYIDYLSKLLNASTTVQEGESISSEDNGMFGPALQELSVLAYSQPDGIPPSALTEQIKELCRNRLESALAKLTKRTDDFETFCRSVLSIDPSSLSMDDTIRTAVKEASSRMQKLLRQKTKSQTEKDLAQALAMLHAVSIFQLYNEDPDAIEILSDLSQYAERLKPNKTGKSDEGTSELFVEILLSMIARPSSLMRQVSQQVFDAFTSQVSAGGLELLIGPLASGESTKGQKELFNTEDDDMDVGEGGSSGDEEDGDEDENVQDVEDASDFEIDSDVEFVDLNASKEGSDSDDGDEGSEDEDDDQGKPQDLDEFLGKILQSHRLDKDADAESSSSDGDMSDSDMLALDDKLAEVFKQRVQAKPDSKKQKKDAKQSVVNFKHRILDLLDIYIKNEALNPLAFTLLTPLLNLMRTTSTKPLASRACEIILNHQRVLKKARSGSNSNSSSSSDKDGRPEGPAAEGLTALLVEIHEEAGKDNSHAYAKAASAASLVVASAMYASDRDTIKQVAAVYAKTQSDWVLGAVKLQNSFFTDWNNWGQNHAAQAISK
jgi:DNA polymerase phi